jgi:hypothetical protein
MDKDLKDSDNPKKESSYTTFWTASLNLFRELIDLKKGNSLSYENAFGLTLQWMKDYPAKTNKWGPFFEDIPRWSDTQINAMTYAMYVIETPGRHPAWEKTVNNIFQWVHQELDDRDYENYGVIPIDEQTAYRKPGNSHSARQASVELMYWEKTQDTTYITNAVRQLNWATYMVDHDGKNFYPTNAIWMTDGYGDYVRHYLRAMAAAPQLAPAGENHLLRSSSIVRDIKYQPDMISYYVFDPSSSEVLRLKSKPREIRVDDKRLNENTNVTANSWTWQPLPVGGILSINQDIGRRIEIVLE